MTPITYPTAKVVNDHVLDILAENLKLMVFDTWTKISLY